MNSNTIHFFGSKDAQKAFAQSTIDSCNKVLEHYDFVINDISSDISDPKLEATKGPAVAFLKAMRNEWVKCRADAEKALKAL